MNILKRVLFAVTLLFGAVLNGPCSLAQASWINAVGQVSTLGGAEAGETDGPFGIAKFNGLIGLAFDSKTNLFVVERFGHRVRELSLSGIVSAFAGPQSYFAASLPETNYVSFTTFAGIPGLEGTNNGVPSTARFSTPTGAAAVDAFGAVYIADRGSHTVRRIFNGLVTTIAGSPNFPGSSDGSGSAARFRHPTGVALDLSGHVFVADTGNHTIRKISPNGQVSTIGGLAGSVGNAGGTSSLFYDPVALAADRGGNVYVADYSNNAIRKISTNGVVSTISGVPGSIGAEDGPNARFSNPGGIAVDWSTNIYVADTASHTIRKIAPSGLVTTLAGLAGSPGHADGRGSQARFTTPTSLAVDLGGTLFVTEGKNHTVRKVLPDGTVVTIGGSAGARGRLDGTGSMARFNFPYGIAVDYNGTLYVVDALNQIILRGIQLVTPPSASLEVLEQPQSQMAAFGANAMISIDVRGNPPLKYQWLHNEMPLVGATNRDFVISNVQSSNAGPYRVVVNNNVSVVASSSATLLTRDRLADPAANVALASKGAVTRSSSSHLGFAGSGAINGDRAGLGAFSNGYWSTATVELPASLEVHFGGVKTIDEIDLFHIQDNFRYPGQPTRTMTFSASGLTDFDVQHWSGSAWVTIPGGKVVNNRLVWNKFLFEPIATPAIRVLALGSPDGYARIAEIEAYSSSGVPPASTNLPLVTTVAGTGIAGFRDGLGALAQFNGPNDLVVDWLGNIYVADGNNHRIRKIAADGLVSTFAGTGVAGFADGPAENALLNFPLSVGFALNAAPNVALLIADTGNNRIRRISLEPFSSVTTYAGSAAEGYLDGSSTVARFNFPNDVTPDSVGNIYVSEFNNHVIRKILPGGEVTTFVGAGGLPGYQEGTGPGVRLDRPAGIVRDLMGNSFVSEWGNQRIRKITESGMVSTIAGSGLTGFIDGSSTNAQFNEPDDLAIDRFGNIYVADRSNHAIRKIAANGVVTTVAGMGQAGFQDGFGSNARFAFPSGLALDSAGSLFVADTGNHVIRRITFPPQIGNQLRNTNLTAGETLRLYADVIQSGIFTVQWLFNGQPLPGATNQLLTLVNLQSTNAGNYSVIVRNEAGSVESAIAIVTISIFTTAQRALPSYYTPGIAVRVLISVNPPAGTSVYALEDSPPFGWTVGAISDGGTYDSANRKVKFGPFFDQTARTPSYEAIPPSTETGVKTFAGTVSLDGQGSPIGGTNSIAIAPLIHPADNKPSDNRISIDELTTYGTAWRKGFTWPVAPSPIPIDYVTRAGTLWRGGESYKFDPGIATPPLWWVNFPVLAGANSGGVVAHSAPASSAARTLPASFHSGQPFTVKISITPANTVQAFAVEEAVPVGWNVTDVGASGEFESANHLIRWGPFLDHQARELTYRIVPPRNSLSEVAFAGVASFDGASIAIAGQARIRPSSNFLVHLTGIPTPLLMINNGGGPETEIQGSSDLTNWITLGTVTNLTGESFFRTPSTSAPRQFYRGVQK